MWVAILGPDGAGKSGVIDYLETDLAAQFSSTRRYHLRPHFGKRWRSTPPVLNPHAQTARSFFASLVKLLLWFADYWLGYLFAVRPCVKRGGLVLFDRYGHDLLVDCKRYRLPIRAFGCARLLVQALPVPDLFVLLHAPAEELQRRKSEVSFLESQRQVRDYLNLMGSLPNAVVIDALRPLDSVAKEACQLISLFREIRARGHQVAFVTQ